MIAGVIVFSKIENAPQRAESHDGEMPLIAFPTAGLLPLCLIGAAPLLVEGAGIDWSAIYMRDVFDVRALHRRASPSPSSRCSWRWRGSTWTRWSTASARGWSPASLLGVAALGLILVGLSPHPYVSLFGFLLMGLGCSSVYPLAVSAAAQRTDRPASVNVASLGQMTFTVFFLGPPLLGFVAEHFGIRSSYFVVVPLVVAAMLVINALAPRPVPILDEPEPVTPHG